MTRSKGTIKALFLRHEGYLGAVGAFVRNVPGSTSSKPFLVENFSHVEKIAGSSLTTVGVLDTLPQHDVLVPFPFLETSSYRADTLLLNQPDAQAYWIDLLDKNLSSLLELALEWQDVNGCPSPAEIPSPFPSSSGKGSQRVDTFEAMYRAHLKQLKLEPKSYGALTIRR